MILGHRDPHPVHRPRRQSSCTVIPAGTSRDSTVVCRPHDQHSITIWVVPGRTRGSIRPRWMQRSGMATWAALLLRGGPRRCLTWKVASGGALIHCSSELHFSLARCVVICYTYPMKQITYTATAQKALRKIGHVEAKRIVGKIVAYASDPAAQANNVKALQGSDYLRLRVGDYRVIFTEDMQVLVILQIGHRKDVYK